MFCPLVWNLEMAFNTVVFLETILVPFYQDRKCFIFTRMPYCLWMSLLCTSSGPRMSMSLLNIFWGRWLPTNNGAFSTNPNFRLSGKTTPGTMKWYTPRHSHSVVEGTKRVECRIQFSLQCCHTKHNVPYNLSNVPNKIHFKM